MKFPLQISEGKLRGDSYSLTAVRLLIVYLFYFLTRVIFYLFNADLIPLEGSDLWRLFKGSLLFDTSAIFYTNSLFILLSLLPYRHRTHPKYQRWVSAAYMIPNSLGIVLNLGDTIYFRFTGRRTTLSVFREFTGQEWLGFTRFFLSYWHMTLIGVGLIVLLYVLYRRTAVRPGQKQPAMIFYPVSLLLLLLTMVFSVFCMRGTTALESWPISTVNASYYTTRSEQVSLILNTPFTVIRASARTGVKVETYFTDEEANKLYGTERVLPDSASIHSGLFKGKNVILIMWESLSREWVGCLNQDIPNYKGFTPFLDELCGKSYVFTDAYANGTQSVDAMPSIMLSIPRMGESYVLSPYVSNKVHSLVNIFNEMGYETSYFHGASEVCLGFAAFATQIGFDHHFGREDYGDEKDFDGKWGIFDEPFLQYFAHKQGTMREPFFSTVFTLSSHEPYRIPKHLESTIPHENMPMQRAIRYTDYSLRRFFETASQQSWYPNTVFVIVADHSCVGERPEYKNPLGRFSVPIILFDPSASLTGRDSTICQQLDIMPTLLHLLGYEGSFQAYGHNIFSPQEDHSAVFNLEGTPWIYRDSLILSLQSGSPGELYDRHKDPSLRVNLVDNPEYISSRDSLAQSLKAFLQVYTHKITKSSLTPGN